MFFLGIRFDPPLAGMMQSVINLTKKHNFETDVAMTLPNACRVLTTAD